MSKDERKCPLKIENLEPYFIWQFGMKIPNNLKPKRTTFKDLELSEEELFDLEIFKVRMEELSDINDEESQLYSKYDMKCIKECVTGCRKFRALEYNIDQLAKNPNDNYEFNVFRERYPWLYWLTNKLGRDKRITGLTVKGLEELEEGVYQIGMQETSTKEYFRYISTSKKRRVNIRMILFNQYQRVQNTGNKRELADFFIRFNQFEDLINGSYESMFFHLDIYGDRLFKLRTLEGIEVKEDKFGFDIDFDMWIEKIMSSRAGN